MAEPPLDHGVQIRFISDLREPRRPPRPPRARGGSYGVAVRVQGIAGQPFVVLNSGERGGDSFGVQIKGGHPETPPRAPLARPPSGSEEEEEEEGEEISGRCRGVPKGWEKELGGVQGVDRFSEEEGSGGSRGVPKSWDEETSGRSRGFPKSWDEELRKGPKPSDQEIPGGSRGVPKSWDEETSGRSRGVPKPSDQHLNIPKSSEELRRSQSHGDLSAPFPKSGEKSGKKDGEIPRIPGDVDTEPLRSVDSLITKFDGNLPRGRAARRFRGPGAAPRKRSQSLDARNSRESAAIPPQIPQIPRGFGGVEEQSVEMQLKSTPDLLRDQRELGGGENPTELIYSILKEGSSESEISLKRKTSRLLGKFQELASSVGAPDLPQSQILREALDRKSQELQRSQAQLSELRAAKEALEARLGHLEGQLLAPDPKSDPKSDPDTQGLYQ
ncbi:cingulin-like, partial [Onychostruthus taczanowskii]|uniref:cingulin-like n=1 Tax=Onychostruthus taczanowskii TaxID=356909 RepID=UPI001B80C0CB